MSDFKTYKQLIESITEMNEGYKGIQILADWLREHVDPNYSSANKLVTEIALDFGLAVSSLAFWLGCNHVSDARQQLTHDMAKTLKTINQSSYPITFNACLSTASEWYDKVKEIVIEEMSDA